MNKRQFEQILKSGEGAMVEFKQAVSSSLGREICAFANTAGGRIFIGVDDKNAVSGCKLTNQVKSRIQDIANNCDPRVPITIKSFKYKDKELIVITVPESADKPIQCSEGFFLREGANSQKMTRNEIFYWAQKTRKIRYESQLREDFQYPEDFNEESFAQLMKKMNVTITGQPEDMLKNLGLGENKKGFIINNAGIMLFGDKRRDLYIRQVYVTCVLYKGINKVKIIDRKDFRDDLVQDYENAFKFLQQHLRLEYVIEGGRPREEIPEIPYEALKEALLNAIIHRDYFEIGARVMVEIFDDRVEISNPGELLVDEKEFGQKAISVARNPILFDIFHRLQLIEKVGTGIQRIITAIQARKLSIEFYFGRFFAITFFRPVLTGQQKDILESVPDMLPKIPLKKTEESKAYTGQEAAKNRTRSSQIPDKIAKIPLKKAEEDIVDTGQVPDKNRTSLKQRPDKLRKILKFCSSPKPLKEIMDYMNLKHRETFINNYLKPLLNEELLAFTMPNKPKSRNQKYIITEKGKKKIRGQTNFMSCNSRLPGGQIDHIELTPDKIAKILLEKVGEDIIDTGQVPDENRTSFKKTPDKLMKILKFCSSPKSLKEIMDFMNLKHRETFINNYLKPLLNEELLAFTTPNKPKSRNQKYIITEKGRNLLKKYQD
jgi:ATP-dependent DNA helicase RecG